MVSCARHSTNAVIACSSNAPSAKVVYDARRYGATASITFGYSCMVMTTPVPTTHSQVWRVPAQANLSWRRWPGEVEYVFYHGASGDTHQLSELAGVIMELILEGQGLEADLLQWLSDQGDTAAETTLAGVLEELQKLDFIEPVHASD